MTYTEELRELSRRTICGVLRHLEPTTRAKFLRIELARRCPLARLAWHFGDPGMQARARYARNVWNEEVAKFCGPRKATGERVRMIGVIVVCPWCNDHRNLAGGCIVCRIHHDELAHAKRMYSAAWEGFARSINSGDDVARMAFSDWLEENGYAVAAAAMREQ